MSREPALSPDDVFILIMKSPLLIPMLSGVVLGAWKSSRDWAVEHDIVADEHEAIVEIPGWDGAGLGGVHLVLAGALIVAAAAAVAVVVRRRRTRRVREE